ncbi:hypothetical protein PVK06_001309 [Gossypium arboreum]|uniref:RNase H type-1 domain-containing protein n=1 Tax=Gossypium arboreum TaxID=29729 RepID=A0ABR0R0P4_GOSAR|nr:hypothetical protein PVK06_001309 [Gossypium arboreum]
MKNVYLIREVIDKAQTGTRYGIFKRSKIASLAAVARVSDGLFITGANALIFARSLVPEALAIRLGSMLAKTQQWRNIILESDNQTVINCLKGKCQPLWECVAIRDDISH